MDAVDRVHCDSSETFTNPLLDAALYYATQKRWHVFPLHDASNGPFICSCSKGSRCKSPAKHPRTAHGINDATTDPETIEEWWTRWPHANIGIACGPSGIWSLDFDGTDGLTALAELDSVDLGGMRLQTGIGEQRVFLAGELSPREPAVGVDHGIDIRAGASYFIGPPSIHYTGRAYQWLARDGTPAESVVVQETPPGLLGWLSGRINVPQSPSPQHEQPAQKNGTRPLTPQNEIDLSTALDFLDDGSGRDEWLRVGFAIYELGWGEEGFKIWEEWSARWPEKYDAEDQRATWKSFARGYRGSKLTIASIFKEASSRGWRSSKQSSPYSHNGSHPIEITDESDPVPFAPIPLRADEMIDPDHVVPLTLDPLRMFVERVSWALQVPPQMVLLSLMPAASSVCAPHFRVDVPGESWREPLMLWSLVIASSGSKKSPTMAQIVEPFRAWENTSTKDEHDAATRKLFARLAAAKVKLSTFRKDLSNNPDNEECSSRFERASFEVASLEAQYNKNSNPRNILISDTTPERLVSYLAENNGRAFYFNTEGDGVRTIVEGSYGQSASIGAWNQCYDGNGFCQHRERGDRIARNADLAVAIMTQPAELQDILGDAKARQRGFFARFLIANQPATQQDPESILAGRRVRPDDRIWWDRWVAAGLEVAPDGKRTIGLSPGAVELLRWFARDYAQQLNRLVDPSIGRDERDEWQMKHVGRLLRIAGVYACMAVQPGALHDSRKTPEIDEETLGYAFRWSRPLEANYFSAVDIITAPAEHSIGDRVMAFIDRRNLYGRPVSRREIFRNLGNPKRGGVRQVCDLDSTLNELCARGYLAGVGTEKRNNIGGTYFQKYVPNKALRRKSGP